MAEPWNDDFVALDQRSRIQPRSLAATRAHFLSHPETTKMQFFKNRPLLAFTIVLALAGVASGAAYAVHEVFVSVDPDKSTQEIETDVKQQFESAGVSASVHAEKNGDRVYVNVVPDDATSPGEIHVQMPEGAATTQRAFMLDFAASVSEAQQQVARDATGATPVIDAVADNLGDATLVQRIQAELAKVGFHDVEVTPLPDAIRIHIKAPPR